MEKLSNRTLVSRLNNTIHEKLDDKREHIEEYFEDKNEWINDKMSNLEQFGESLEVFDNMTIS